MNLIIPFTLGFLSQFTYLSVVAVICEKEPELFIAFKSPDGSGFNKHFSKIHENKENEIFLNRSGTVEIECISSIPLTMDFHGETVHKFTNETKRRYSEDCANETSYCFSHKLIFSATESSTGNYSCTTINIHNTHSYNASVYIFASNGKGKQLLNSGRCITTEVEQLQDQNILIIPCVVTDKNSTPKIYRSNSSRCTLHLPTDPENDLKFEYDPKKGFTIDNITEALEDQGQTWFICVLNEQIVEVQVRKPKDYRVTPQENTIVDCQSSLEPTDVTNYVNSRKYPKFTFTCESTANVHFNYSKINDTNVNTFKTEHPNNYYKYFATLKYRGQFENVSTTVKCLNSSGDPLHIWTIVHKKCQGETSKSEPLHFDERQKSFFCYSPYLPKLTLVDCENQLNCKIAKRFIKLKGRAYPLPDDKGYPCRKHTGENIYPGCTEYPIQKGKPYGMAHCITHDEEHYFRYYFTNLLGNVVTNLKFNHSAVNESIYFKNITRTVYTKEVVTFKCEASRFMFSLGFHINITTIDGENLHQNQFLDSFAIFNETYFEEKIITYFNITIWRIDIKTIHCSIPTTTTKRWISVNQDITVEEGEDPKIWPVGDLQVTFYDKDVNQSLNCNATGYPQPRISWTKLNNGLLYNGFNIYESGESNYTSSKLIFPHAVPILSGNYICIATNAKGSVNVTFQVEVKDPWLINPVYLWTVGPIIIILFLLTVILLIKKLRNQKKAIEKLTEAEILEFENGNEKLLRHTSELSEIAQYLPYNKDYEIPGKNLELFDEDLLGKGAFGIVLKGYLENDGKKCTVAIKTVKSSSNVAQLKKLLAELKIMMYIGRHPNIIKIIGAQTIKLRDGKVNLIVEYCPFGNLQNFLRECRADFVNQVHHDRIDKWIRISRSRSIKHPKNPFTKLPENPQTFFQPKRISQPTYSVKTLDLVRWCYELANGMEYLAQKKVIHGDLATRNLLLAEDWQLKITDFGLSRHMYEYTNYIRKKKEEPLPWRWLSVEAIRDSKFSIMSDVWAFGY